MSAPSDKAAARVLDVEEEEVEYWYGVGDTSLLACPFLGAWRRSCRALARAFSWVLTNCAKFYAKSVKVSFH